MIDIIGSYRRALFTCALLLGLLGMTIASAGADAASKGREIEEARALAGVTNPPKQRYATPNGHLRLERSELLASYAGQKVEFTVELDREVDASSLLVEVPQAWTDVPESGIRPSKPPVLDKPVGAKAKLERDGRLVEVEISEAEAGATATFSIEDVGIAAGEYELPYFWRYESGKVRKAGTARVVFYAPELEDVQETEGEENPWTLSAVGGVFANASNNGDENSEPFVAVSPGNPNRIAVGTNSQAGVRGRRVSITSNGGRSWRNIDMPEAVWAAGNADTEYHDVCCDPAFATDGLGNIWFSAITSQPNRAEGETGPDSRIVVNRIAAGEERFQPRSTGLPRRSSTLQDKQMMAMDNTPTSPTFGRLYVVWDETGFGNKIVISKCDTRVAGVPNAARCDDPNNWSRPADVRNPNGDRSVIYADVAVGPTGRLFVTWWNYSAANAIQGTSCLPSSVKVSPLADNCTSNTFTGWAVPSTIALMDKSGGTPLPFMCPTFVRPSGRAGSVPSVEVDNSGLTDHGRVYVSWSDLRPGSGTTKCGPNPKEVNPPKLTHLSWDNFVTSRSAERLPGGAAASATVGTRTQTAYAKSEDILPWMSVDQMTGQAWVDGYSTGADPYRAEADFFVRGVTPRGSGSGYGASGHGLGYNQLANVNKTDYSSGSQLNDHGDYTGLDATAGMAFPAFTDNSDGDGEASTFVPSGAARIPGGALKQLASSYGCWSEAGGECSNGKALRNPNSVVVSPDGRHVYALTGDYESDYGVAAFQRTTTSGTLKQLAGTAGCITETGLNGEGLPGECANGKGLFAVDSVAMSPDGKYVYVGGYDSIAILIRNPTTGALTQSGSTTGCITDDGKDTHNEDSADPYSRIVCQKGLRGLGSSVDRLRISSDGKSLYAYNGVYSGAIAIFSRNATNGLLTQLSGTAGCITPDGSGGSNPDPPYEPLPNCALMTALNDNGIEDLAITKDGKNVYVAGNKDVLLFSRNTTTGALTPFSTRGCMNAEGERGCVNIAAGNYADSIRVSPDDRHVYVGSDYSYGTIAVLQRSSTGGLLQSAGKFACITGERTGGYYYEGPSKAPEGCVEVSGMYGLTGFEISPDGGSLHLSQGGYGMVNLDRDRITGALSQPPAPYFCASEDGQTPQYASVTGDCLDTRATSWPDALAISPDSRFLYAAGYESDAISVFSRKPSTEVPYCTRFRSTVGINRAKQIRLLCNDETSDPLTYEIVTRPAHGTLGTIDQTKDTTLYTPTAGYRGGDSFTYRAKDATGVSTTTTVYINVY